jgi:hypothetical protein
MVSTRSKTAGKHEAPKLEKEGAPKRQKTAKGAKKAETEKNAGKVTQLPFLF